METIAQWKYFNTLEGWGFFLIVCAYYRGIKTFNFNVIFNFR